MDRLDYDQYQTQIEAMREENASVDYSAIEDARDRGDREAVAYYESGTDWTPSVLKRDDDVMVQGEARRVVGPAIGRQYFLAWNTGESGLGVYPLVDVTDRAPLDPEEEPMPVVPPPEVP